MFIVYTINIYCSCRRIGHKFHMWFWNVSQKDQEPPTIVSCSIPCRKTANIHIKTMKIVPKCDTVSFCFWQHWDLYYCLTVSRLKVLSNWGERAAFTLTSVTGKTFSSSPSPINCACWANYPTTSEEHDELKFHATPKQRDICRQNFMRVIRQKSSSVQYNKIGQCFAANIVLRCQQ